MNSPNYSPSINRDVTVISLVGLAHATSHFFQLVIPPLFPWLMKDFSLSFTSVGLLMTVFFLISGIGQSIAGFAVDQYGGRKILLIGLALLCVSGLLLAAAKGQSMLMLAAAVAGMGNAVFHPADYTMLNRQVSAKTMGHAFSAHGLTGTLGWAAAPVFMFAIANFSTWRIAAISASGVALLSFLILLWHDGLRPNPSLEEDSNRITNASEKLSTFGFLSSSDVWRCFAFFLCWTLAFSALQNFAPTVLRNIYNVQLSVATLAVTCYMLGSAAGTIAGGFLASSASPDRAVAWGLSFAALIALLLSTGSPPSATVIPLMTVMGFAAGLAGPSRDMLVRKSAVSGAGAASYGRIYGFVYSGLDAGLAISPILFGQLMDSSQFPKVMVGIALFQGLAIFTALRVGAHASAAVRQS